MKQAVIISPGRSSHQHVWARAFAEGLIRHGWKVSLSPVYRPADLVVIWGVRQRHHIATQRLVGEVCVLERGYIGDRFSWTSVSFGGGLNGRGNFRVPNDPTRWEKLFSHLMKPWQDRPGPAIIMGQVLSDMSLKDLDPMAIWADAIHQLRDRGLDVEFRPHPLAGAWGLPGVPNVKGDLSNALNRASLVVTINSNSAVDAVIAGVPSVTLDEGSMAWPVTSHSVDHRYTPEREAWAHRLAWCQYSIEEISSGKCWEVVQHDPS